MIPDIQSILESLQAKEITIAEALRLINLHIQLAANFETEDLRTFFAGKIIHAWIENEGFDSAFSQDMPKLAWKLADDMVKVGGYVRGS